MNDHYSKKRNRNTDYVAVEDTVKRLKILNLKDEQKSMCVSQTQHSNDNKIKLDTIRRVSSRSEAPDRKNFKVNILRIYELLTDGEISQGQALKLLRTHVLNIKQTEFADLVKVSRKTISELENDKGNYTPEIINKAFKPFGLKMGLVLASSINHNKT